MSPGLEDRQLGISISSTPTPFTPDNTPGWAKIGGHPLHPGGGLFTQGACSMATQFERFFSHLLICGKERNLADGAPASKELTCVFEKFSFLMNRHNA